MSTDYYLVCKKCKTGIDIASDGMSGFKFYYGDIGCMKALKAFIEEHVLCDGPLDIRLESEHVVYENDDFKDIQWPTNNSKGE